MPFKLGELLLREKIITAGQLEEALKKHVVYGIKLGSSLVEMGYVDEEQLAALLSEKLKVPRIESKEVLSAPREVVKLITSDQASEYRMIPFHLTQNRLSVAMSDPTHFKGIDEIGFVTGKVVKVHIAPDVVISKALSKFYNISGAESRYHQVALKNPKNIVPEEPQTVTFQMPSDTGELLQVTVPVDFGGFGNLPEPEPESQSKSDLKFETCVLDQVIPPSSNSATESDADAVVHKAQAIYPVDQASIDFAAVNSREELADVFIKYLGMDFSIGGLFLIHGNEAICWRGISRNARLPAFEKQNIKLTTTSVLKDVVETCKFFMGVLPENPCNRQILYLFRAPSDTPMLVLPVIMLDEVIAVVMVSVYEKNFRWRLMELEKLVRNMSLVFEKLIIEHKILLT